MTESSPETPEIMNGFTNFQYGITSAPFVYKNLVITGAHVVDETGSKGPAGDVRAWDVRTGNSCGPSTPCHGRARWAMDLAR